MAPTDERYIQLYKVTAVLVLSALEYYFIDYIFWTVVLSCAAYAGVVYFLNPPVPQTIDPAGKAILITGCDTGFGKELAFRAHKLGFSVFAGCYNSSSEGPRELECTYEERMHVLQMDVTKDHEVKEALKYVQERCRSTGLWAVVNNAGLDGGGPVELSSLNFYKEICEVNLFGVIRVTKAFLPLVRLAKGRIINVSSERGISARGGNSTYCISKFGLEAFSDCLRHEMREFGVQVSLIEPGHFGGATAILQEHCVEMFRKRLTEGYDSAGGDVKSVYPKEVIDQFVKGRYDAVSSSNISPDPIIDVMERQLIHEKIKARYLVGGTTHIVDPRVIFIYLKNFLPDWIMDYLLCKFPV